MHLWTDWRQMTEDRGQRADDGRQMSENRGQKRKSEVGNGNFEALGREHSA